MFVNETGKVVAELSAEKWFRDLHRYVMSPTI